MSLWVRSRPPCARRAVIPPAPLDTSGSALLPCIGAILPGGRASIVRSVDIAPTILQFLNLPFPATNQGESLVAMISGKRAGIDLPVYAESYYPEIHFNWSPLFGYVSGRYKYIDAPDAELYDLAEDRGELSNVLASNQAIAARLKT